MSDRLNAVIELNVGKIYALIERIPLDLFAIGNGNLLQR